MIDIKVMKEIAEKSNEAVRYMTTLKSMEKREMKWDVWAIVEIVEDYDDLCKEIKKLINEN